MEKSQRIEIQTELIRLIRDTTIRGFCLVSDPVWLRDDLDAYANPEIRRSSNYTALLATCIFIVNEWADKQGYDGKISYVFEAGHANQHEANSLLNTINKDKEAIRRSRYLVHSFLDKTQSPPLQAADMIAWQVYHYWSQRITQGKTRERADFRALCRSEDMIALFPLSSFLPLERERYDPPSFTD